MNVMKYAIIPFLLALPAFGETCPPAKDHGVALQAIITDLQAAGTEGEARAFNDGLWELWTDAPDPKAQRLLDEGMRRISRGDYGGAWTVLDQLVTYCPAYAEGYNQRAFASYLQRDFAAALLDLDRTLAILPNHIGALSGKGLTLIGLGRDAEAQAALKAAVALNPWLSERQLIREPDGTDI